MNMSLVTRSCYLQIPAEWYFKGKTWTHEVMHHIFVHLVFLRAKHQLQDIFSQNNQPHENKKYIFIEFIKRFLYVKYCLSLSKVILRVLRCCFLPIERRRTTKIGSDSWKRELSCMQVSLCSEVLMKFDIAIHKVLDIFFLHKSKL
jgi:hypothetical protein